MLALRRLPPSPPQRFPPVPGCNWTCAILQAYFSQSPDCTCHSHTAAILGGAWLYRVEFLCHKFCAKFWCAICKDFQRYTLGCAFAQLYHVRGFGYDN